MSDDLEDVAYKSRLDESLRVPPPERGPIPPGRDSERLSRAARVALVGDRLMRPMFTLAGILTLAFGLIWLLSLVFPPGDGPTTPDADLVTPHGGLLADLRGDDVIHRLVMTQAALKREMALLREAASRSGAPLPDDVETTFALAAHAAELERLGALVKKLEADQRRLQGLAVVSQAGIAILERHVKELEQALEEQATGERN